ncbi:carboxymuconolactone decarboxylase family protein [Peribacillus simplex]|uniref:carboxymuconolactone decarboxylase family protein n=1 Tax=Peribacillus TaxID=2675229 RepID=UPI0036DD0629
MVSRCDECICYHMEGCLNAGATIDEIMETFKIGVIGGGRLSQHEICHWKNLQRTSSGLSQKEELKE